MKLYGIFLVWITDFCFSQYMNLNKYIKNIDLHNKIR